MYTTLSTGNYVASVGSEGIVLRRALPSPPIGPPPAIEETGLLSGVLYISTAGRLDRNGLQVQNLAGTGRAYACIEANGKIVRSTTPCV
jgi:hypothetical protein